MENDILHPRHYAILQVEPIEIARNLDFCTGNVVKYILRAPFKDGVEDCDKAIQYLFYANNTTRNELNVVSYFEIEASIDELVNWLNGGDGDQLWHDIAEKEIEFLNLLDRYLLTDPRKAGAVLSEMISCCRGLRRILDLRDKQDEIYKGMTGMPGERV